MSAKTSQRIAILSLLLGLSVIASWLFLMLPLAQKAEAEKQREVAVETVRQAELRLAEVLLTSEQHRIAFEKLKQDLEACKGK